MGSGFVPDATSAIMQTQKESLNSTLRKSRAQSVSCAPRTGSSVQCQALCLLPHCPGERPYTMRSGLHIKRRPALNATRYSGLDLGTEKGHEWKNMKSKQGV